MHTHVRYNRCGKKVTPKLFTVFSATAWDFCVILHTFTWLSYLYLSAMCHLIIFKFDEVIDILAWPLSDFLLGQPVTGRDQKRLLRASHYDWRHAQKADNEQFKQTKWLLNIRQSVHCVVSVTLFCCVSAQTFFSALKSLSCHAKISITSLYLKFIKCHLVIKGKNQKFTTTYKVDYTDVTQLKLQKW